MHNGCPPEAAPGTKLLILPSQPGSGAPVDYPAAGFLVRGNRIKTDCFRFQTRAGGAGLIDVVRPDSKSLDVKLRAAPKTQKLLRSIEWVEFQKVQAEFEQFLFEKTACKCICIFTSRTPRQRFGAGYERQLQGFWVECLKGSSYKAFTAREEQRTFKPFSRRAPQPPTTADAESTSAEDGVPKATRAAGTTGQMGVIPLYPGMRLSIHWGATAVYPGGSSSDHTYSRQTVGGSTFMPIHTREGAEVLGAGWHWNMGIAHPNQNMLGVELPPSNPPKPRGMPYGHKLATGVAEKLVTVFNEFDLRQAGAALFHRSRTQTGQKLGMYLLVPAEYTKADLVDSSDEGFRRSAQVTSDARSVKDNKTTPGAESFARRYMVWLDNAGALGSITPDFTSIQTWSYPALSFGNQTWVEPELAVSLNGAPAEWMPVGSTLGDVVETHAMWLLTHPPANLPRAPLLTVFRSKRIAEEGKAASGDSIQLRFWVIPPGFLKATEIHPGDALFYKP